MLSQVVFFSVLQLSCLWRSYSLAVTNDCHIHSQSCKRPLLWLLQAAFGLERQHLQGAVQGVPGFLCHVHRHQHHLQVRQKFRKILKARLLASSSCLHKQLFGIFFFFFFLSRFFLHDNQKRCFEKLAIYCNHYASLIPMSFVLGELR